MATIVAPNRLKEVTQLCKEHPEVFINDVNHDIRRLAFLAGTIVPTLNALDTGQWGLITKPELGNKVPVDAIMYKRSREIFDVLTGTGPCWISFPPPPDSWIWTPAEKVFDGDPDPDPADTPYDEAQVSAYISDEAKAYSEAKAEFNGYAAIWTARMQFDAPKLGYKASRAKHLAELREALGLSS